MASNLSAWIRPQKWRKKVSSNSKYVRSCTQHDHHLHICWDIMVWEERNNDLSFFAQSQIKYYLSSSVLHVIRLERYRKSNGDQYRGTYRNIEKWKSVCCQSINKFSLPSCFLALVDYPVCGYCWVSMKPGIVEDLQLLVWTVPKGFQLCSPWG